MEESIKSFKVVLLGEGAVGKTSLMIRYTEDKFNDEHVSTVQAAFASKILELSGASRAELAIWDTAGQERFHALGPIYYRDSQGALLVYDISDQKSFDRVKNWVKELRSMLADKVVIFIVGNKTDLARYRAIPVEEAKQYAQSIGAHFRECSAKTNERVSELFSDLAKTSSEAAVAFGEFGTTPFQRHYGSRRSLRIADEAQTAPGRRKCCR
uniref:Ras-related protein Rab-21 n=1 Tax=Globodera pallida TaxID=36090 RepID=A0A183C526_GLOPA